MEKQLGLTAKRQIEDEVGIAEFTRLCKESVRNYVGEWKTLTERIGYWIDIDDAYWTFSPEYVESVWANLKSLWDQDLLYEDIKVVPYCPRCGTALSSHELGQPDVYREVEDESAYVRLPLTDEGRGRRRTGRHPGPDLGRRPRPHRLDDHPVDPAVQHRRGGRPRARLRGGRRRRGGGVPRRAGLRRGGVGGCTRARLGAGGPPLPPPLRRRGHVAGRRRPDRLAGGRR